LPGAATNGLPNRCTQSTGGHGDPQKRTHSPASRVESSTTSRPSSRFLGGTTSSADERDVGDGVGDVLGSQRLEHSARSPATRDQGAHQGGDQGLRRARRADETTTLHAVINPGGPTWLSPPKSRRAPQRFGRSRSSSPRQNSRRCVRASRRRAGPNERPSTIRPRASG
jgi:hypothetical protein